MNNEKKNKITEFPPYKCKMCGLHIIEEIHEICPTCGWEDDGVQNNNHNYEGGANYISYNQYEFVWQQHKEEIVATPSSLRNRKTRESFNNKSKERFQAK